MEALKDAKILNNLSHVGDGAQAMSFLRRGGGYEQAPRPDVILLDLDLPGIDGRDVLAEIKSDETLRRIPVVILTSSKAEEDVLRSYDLNANCYITKPINLDEFLKVIRHIEDFWLSIVTLPRE